jgi:BASS family bile acid:Na+ symporter
MRRPPGFSIHTRLLWWVLGSAVLGLALPSWGNAIRGAVPVMLAGQVIGVALTLTASEFAVASRRPWTIVATLLVQWTVMPLTGVVLLHLIPSVTVGHGALIVAVAPAEITSALVAILAGGAGALATTCMAGSLALSTVLTPLWIGAVLGSRAHVDARSLMTELVISVTLPLLLGVALRTRFPALMVRRGVFLDVAAISVILVVFVGAGSARGLPVSGGLLTVVLACATLAVIGYAAGCGAGAILHLSRAERRAILFPIGMREFGVATAVAVAIDPPAAAVAGLYGIIIMAASTAAAAALTRAPLNK